MRFLLLVPFVPMLALADVGPTVAFGGFSAGGDKYLNNDDICTPGAVAGGKVTHDPACTAGDRKSRSALNAQPPKRTKTLPDGRKLGASAEGAWLVISADDTPLFRWNAKQPIQSVTGCFASDDGKTLAFEFVGKDGAQAVAFTLSATAAAPVAPASQPATPAPAPAKGNAFDKAMGQGGVWGQDLVPCDTAGVTLTLKKDLSFALRIQTRCQGNKHTDDFNGKWTPVGDDQLTLTLPNQDAQDDAFTCNFQSCEDEPTEMCLSCLQGDDVAFTMKVVKR